MSIDIPEGARIVVQDYTTTAYHIPPITSHTSSMLDQLDIPHMGYAVGPYDSVHIASENLHRFDILIISTYDIEKTIQIVSQYNGISIVVPNDKKGLMKTINSNLPVLTMAIGKPGAINAALMAARILGVSDESIANKVKQHMKNQTESVPEKPYD